MQRKTFIEDARRLSGTGEPVLRDARNSPLAPYSLRQSSNQQPQLRVMECVCMSVHGETVV